jgi:kinesin family member 2/24
VNGSLVESVDLCAFEIRGSEAFDLLSDPALSPVKIMAASDNDTSGLTTHPTTSTDELLTLVRKAGTLRTTRSTIKNDTSSR